MTTYAIGNVNSNIELLHALLDKIAFDQQQDKLWFTGNLINPAASDPLAVIRFIRQLGKAASTVLGEQEFKLFAAVEGFLPEDDDLPIAQLVNESDFAEILKWLRQQSLIRYDGQLKFVLVHAGIPPEWSLSQASTFAIEVESALSFNHKALLQYINDKPAPRRWNAKLQGWKRLHFISHALTRMQQCNEKGYMDFGVKLNSTAADEYRPWYQHPNRQTANVGIIFAQRTATAEQTYPNIFPLYADNASLSGLKLGAVPERIMVC